MIWTLAPQPGNPNLTVRCTPAEYAELLAAGEVWFDGQRAVPVASECVEALGHVRLRLDEPFRMPPLVLSFEAHEVASRIVETGWYTFEGALYVARSGVGPGDVQLDRVFAADPTPTYEGHTMPVETVAVPVGA